MMKWAATSLLDGQRRQLQLPQQVVAQTLASRVGGVDRRPVVGPDHLAHSRMGIRVEVVLPVDVGDLLGIGRLALRGLGIRTRLGLRFGIRGAGGRKLGGRLGGVDHLVRLTGLRRLGGRAVLVDLHALFEDRVLLELLVHEVDQLHARQLQQLDRLLKLRRHHQLLTEPYLLLELERHGVCRPVPSRELPSGQLKVLAQVDLAHLGIGGDLFGGPSRMMWPSLMM